MITATKRVIITTTTNAAIAKRYSVGKDEVGRDVFVEVGVIVRVGVDVGAEVGVSKGVEVGFDVGVGVEDGTVPRSILMLCVLWE